jgi:hypothetical protein
VHSEYGKGRSEHGKGFAVFEHTEKHTRQTTAQQSTQQQHNKNLSHVYFYKDGTEK